VKRSQRLLIYAPHGLVHTASPQAVRMSAEYRFVRTQARYRARLIHARRDLVQALFTKPIHFGSIERGAGNDLGHHLERGVEYRD
jgi:hypothetical protein